MGMKLRQASLAAMCIAGALLAAGCKEVQDIREEMGWAKQKEAPPPPPVVSLADRWVPADTGVGGFEQAQWSQRWWRWSARFGADTPSTDRDGSRCALNQDDGPVWFLAGTDGSFDAVRTCTVPADRHLFLPLISWTIASDDVEALEAPLVSCQDKQGRAARFADHVFTGLVLLDGRPIGELKRMRVANRSCFAMADGSPVVAGDGYWLMLKPLPPGEHTLAVAAGYREGPRQSMQNFQYTLQVQGAEASGEEVAEGEAAESIGDADQGGGGGSLTGAADIAG
jgi:hypothetical protein